MPLEGNRSTPLKTPPRMLHKQTSVSVQFTPHSQDVVISMIYSWPELKVSSCRNRNIMKIAECHRHTEHQYNQHWQMSTVSVTLCLE